MKASSNNLRGQMGLRSGPLAPTSAKLTTQYIVLDHMTNHYSKITKAKPAIDNKPPRSMSTSQKARDRKTRDVVMKTGKRPTSSATTRRPYTSTGYYQDDIYDENLWGEVDPEDEEEMLIHNIMRTTLKGQDPVPDTNQNYTYQASQRQRPSSARSARSVGSGVARSMIQVKKPSTYDGDLLQKRSHVFTEEKPFTPRTLKTDRKSRLSQYKYYNKLPPKDTKSKQQTSDTHPESKEHTEQETVDKRPQPKPRGSKRLDQTREGPVTMNSLMFETLHSRDFSNQQNGNSDVPKLDISMDKDHLKWIKDQASKAHHRSNNDTMKSTLREEEEEPCDTTIDYGKTGEMSLTFGTLGSTKTRPPLGSSHRSNPEDEEGLYVRFMKDVTNDIINRGIYTDRAVRQVFKTHINKNKGILNELRMRQITDDIRQQLNIPRYDIDDDTSYTSMRDNTQNHHSSNDLHLQLTTSTMGQDHGEFEPTLNGTQGSQKSKVSRGSTDHSQDTYNFKSTEEEDLFSTIRSDMNNTGNLTDTMALRSYQASIKEQEGEDLEDGEVVLDKYGRPLMNGHVESHGSSVIHSKQSSVQHSLQNSAQHSRQTSAQHSRQTSAQNSRQTSAQHSRQNSERGEDEDDDYEDEIYEDDGDDEDDDDDDVMQSTEPVTTYRTEDDDF